jgi:hypothetical protein
MLPQRGPGLGYSTVGSVWLLLLTAAIHGLTHRFRCFSTDILKPEAPDGVPKGLKRIIRSSHPKVPSLAENELICFALANAEMALHRKHTILQTARELEKDGVFDGSHSMTAETKVAVRKHMNWLLDSLVEADYSYKVARECVRRLTEMPAEDTMLSPRDISLSASRLPPSVVVPRDSLADAHASQLVLHASLATKRSVASAVARGPVDREMTGILEAVGQLLVVSAVHTGEFTPEGHVLSAVPTALSASIQPLLQMFEVPSDLPDMGNFETHLYNNALNDRGKALEALLEAANLLNIECKAAVRQSGSASP